MYIIVNKFYISVLFLEFDTLYKLLIFSWDKDRLSSNAVIR